MIGNGLCTRPVELDCRMESACETCSYFQTTIEFRPPSSANETTHNNTTNPTASPSSKAYSRRSTTMVLDTITRITPDRERVRASFGTPDPRRSVRTE